MREIKFRVWNNADKSMHYPDWDELAQRTKFVEMKLMQYTGLKDKNGKEIYEGDIVKVTSISFGTRIGQVRFAKSAFWYDFGEQEDGYNSELVFMPIRAEVIGNIYENKDLLEAK